ncbi:MAG: hypothetical protein KJ069_16135 [Anaerolineae bacterium]|nr:hypothetical protein [Anaerolineae bacterium]
MTAEIFGLIVTGIAIFLGFLQWRKSHKRDQGDLTVSAIFQSKGEGGIAIFVRLRNKGRHPVYVERIDLRLKSGTRLPYKTSHGFDLGKPIEVTETEPKDVLFALSLYMKDIVEPTQIKHIEIQDTLGNVYKYPKWLRSRYAFQKQVKSEWTPEMQEYWKLRLNGENDKTC